MLEIQKKLELSWLSRQWLHMERGAPSELPPVPCSFVFPGLGGGDALGDIKEGAGGPFLFSEIWEGEAHTETASLTDCQMLSVTCGSYPCEALQSHPLFMGCPQPWVHLLPALVCCALQGRWSRDDCGRILSI